MLITLRLVEQARGPIKTFECLYMGAADILNLQRYELTVNIAWLVP